MNIDNLKGQFRDYARSNFFRIRFNVPANNEGGSEQPTLLQQIGGAIKDLFAVPAASRDDMVDFAIKSTSFPSIGIKDSNFEWRGFSMPMPTAIDLGEFTATFICDVDMTVYQYFVEWLQRIADPVSGRTSIASTLAADSATIYQVKNDMTFESAYQIQLTHIYPSVVGAIELGEEEGVMEFQVTFKYSTIINKTLDASAKSSEKSLLDRAKGAITGGNPF